jgi:signal transduction histidine kinase
VTSTATRTTAPRSDPDRGSGVSPGNAVPHAGGSRIYGSGRTLAMRLGYDTRHTDHVLRVFAWVSRVAGFSIVAAETFKASQHDVQARPLQVGGFIVVCLATCLWALIDLRPGTFRNPQPWLALTLGLIAVTSGVICTPAQASLLLVPAAVATMQAGSDLDDMGGATVVGLGVLGIACGAVVYQPGVGTMLGFPLAVIGTYMVGRNRRAYRVQAELAATMLAQAEELQVQQRRADVLDERARIAREIHDVLAHSLGGLSIQIQAARAVLTDHNDVGRALEVLGTAQRMASDGLVETRRAVHALRTDTMSLEEELTSLAETHRAQYRTAVALCLDADPRSRPLPPATTVALLRVSQEALVNAAKHAPHQPVDIHLEHPADQVRLTLTNALGQRPRNDEDHSQDGDLDDDPILETVNGGYGLTGMRERLLLLGGTLTVGRRGKTWTVTAAVPHASTPSAPESEILAP